MLTPLEIRVGSRHSAVLSCARRPSSPAAAQVVGGGSLTLQAAIDRAIGRQPDDCRRAPARRRSTSRAWRSPGAAQPRGDRRVRKGNAEAGVRRRRAAGARRQACEAHRGQRGDDSRRRRGTGRDHRAGAQRRPPRLLRRCSRERGCMLLSEHARHRRCARAIPPRQRFDAGSAPRLEVMQAQLALAAAENEATGRARARRRPRARQLNALLGAAARHGDRRCRPAVDAGEPLVTTRRR